ncbi:MmyB family transcriptional regulator [Nocardiopsis halophila]|uniref:MmyB family transcriptional regulator n=1 Tax=Nocardiopsis halophila TaxID=141692 RepID=UPI0012696F45|nr:hypothetical protein [Nocardiopsis halophila]
MDLSPLPAMVAARLLPDVGALAPSQRNAMWLCLMHPRMRAFYADRERVVREGAAHLRAAWAAHPQDGALSGLIAEFIADDEEFARLWGEREARAGGARPKVVRHPEAGETALDFETLTPHQDPDQVLVIHRAADEQNRSALEVLCAR